MELKFLIHKEVGNITRYIEMPMQDEYIEKLKLIDGYQAVKDDKHIWKTKNLQPEIIIDLTANIKISLNRIWNYNKSRIRSYKGVRLLRKTLDERLSDILWRYLKRDRRSKKVLREL